MKKCTKCGEIKSLDCFSKNKNNKDGLSFWCKDCYKQYRLENIEHITKREKQWHDNNKERVYIVKKKYIAGHKEKILQYKKQWRDNNKEIISMKAKKHREDNKDEMHIKEKEYRENNKETITARINNWRKNHKERVIEIHRKSRKKNRERERIRIKEDLNFRLAAYLRSRLNKALKGKKKSGSAIKDMGCTKEELIRYLESKFHDNPDTGEKMTWENWNKSGWQIDHIIPLGSVMLSDRDQFLSVNNFKNLQPLWTNEHNAKTILDAKLIKKVKCK